MITLKHKTIAFSNALGYVTYMGESLSYLEYVWYHYFNNCIVGFDVKKETFE